MKSYRTDRIYKGRQPTARGHDPARNGILSGPRYHSGV